MLYLTSGYEKRVGEGLESRVTRLDTRRGAYSLAKCWRCAGVRAGASRRRTCALACAWALGNAYGVRARFLEGTWGFGRSTDRAGERLACD
ncbi:hypothetical protein CRG98_004375 [Punica granatum]|uniref:Uncharacterized protein n=1 Tax=Punica granatum TaxID=22663 RepID=A0A2I0L3G3_PUNGR|nr:hypothetical protein CRG98_004375 [Punica granatum]